MINSNQPVPIINNHQLQMFKDIMEECFDDQITIYLDDAKKLVNDLKVAVNQNDMKALRHAAHTLKSPSLQVGAEKVAMLAKEIEYLCDNAITDDVLQYIEAIEVAFEETQKVLEK